MRPLLFRCRFAVSLNRELQAVKGATVFATALCSDVHSTLQDLFQIKDLQEFLYLFIIKTVII
jgi:hypothetical protein